MLLEFNNSYSFSPPSMLCADYDSTRMNLQIGCQLLVFTKNSGPLHVLHFYRMLRKKIQDLDVFR